MSDNIKLVCFDLNETLIHEKSWMDLNFRMGITVDEDEILMKWGSKEIISDRQAQQIILNLYKQSGRHTYENITAVLSNYTYLPGAKETVQYLQDKGYEIALISGSIDWQVEHVANDLKIKHYRANNLFIFDADNYLHDIVTIGYDHKTKLYQLNAIANRLGIKLEECACIGDGANEAEIFKATGNGITFKGSQLADQAWKVINELSDLKEIL